MPISEHAYREACAQLDYIESIKQSLGETLECLTHAERSGMTLPPGGLALAAALLCEAVDDLYYPQTLSLRQCKEGYERERWRRERNPNGSEPELP